MFPSRPSLFTLSTMVLLVYFECVDAVTPYGHKVAVKFKRKIDVIKVLIGLGCVATIVLVVLLLFLYIRRRKRLAEVAAALIREQEMIQQTHSRRAFVESFPVQVYFPPEEGETDTCSICLDEFAEGSNLRLLPLCNHLYHISCIDTHWQVGRPLECPLCRRDYSTWQPEGGPPA